MSETPAETVEGMSMMDHLRELRMRLVRSVLSIGVSTLVLLAFYDPLKNLLTRPYTNLCARRPDFECDGSLFSLGPLDAHKEDRPITETGQVEWPLKNQPNAKKSRINFF